jgi:Protein of unknown function (DUF2946).
MSPVSLRIRRNTAIATLLCVVWTALWPVVASAHALALGDSMPLCHQAGMQVGADEPSTDDTKAPQPGKQHCPLCIMAFLAMPSAPTLVAPDRLAPLDLSRGIREAVRPADLSARLPESRAPPSFLA